MCIWQNKCRFQVSKKGVLEEINSLWALDLDLAIRSSSSSSRSSRSAVNQNRRRADPGGGARCSGLARDPEVIEHAALREGGRRAVTF